MSLSAYVHIPFCTHKCDFCDFAAFAGLSHLESEYCDVVCREIIERARLAPTDEPLQSIFYGGGTPGLIAVENLEKIQRQLVASFGKTEDCEVTIETTPHAITAEKILGWRELGVNRLSIGVESLQDSELKAIGRDHTRAQALAGVECALTNGFDNVAVDFMYALPTQTVESFADSLSQYFELARKSQALCHFSAYGLHLADNSPLYSSFPKNSPQYPSEDKFEDMFFTLLRMAKEEGFEHYEVSNFCKPNRHSRHNLSYWDNSEFLAFGVSAHRYVRGTRSANWRSLKKYMKDYLGSEFSEIIDTETRMRESIMLGLRLRRGLNLAQFQNEFGIDLSVQFRETIAKLSQAGLLEQSDNYLRIADRGVPISNSIIAELF